MAVDSDKLHEMFRADCVQMTDVLDRALNRIQSGTAGPDDIDGAFRAAHSIKSEAAFLRLHDISSAAHLIEEELSSLRGRDARSSRVMINSGNAQMARLKQAVNRHIEGVPPDDSVGDEGRPNPDSVQTGKPDAVTVRLEAELLQLARQRGERLYRLSVRLLCDPAYAYPRAFLLLSNLELVSAVIRCDPAVETVKDEITDRLEFLVATGEDRAVLQRAVNVDEVELVEFAELSYDDMAIPGRAPGEPSPRPDVYLGDSIATGSEEVALYLDEIVFAATQLREINPSDDQAQAMATRLHDRICLLGDVAIGRVVNSGTVQLLDVIRGLETRVVAYALDQGKRVEFSVSGSGALVHQQIADTLLDSLLHVVRNSIYHGIESVDERFAAGKSPAGQIHVGVRHTDGNVTVEVSDDGAGIDEELIRQRTGDQERSLLDVITAPGFTTKDGADRDSGRGVGLDAVVHAARDILSGDVELETHRGRGVVIRIVVPSIARLVRVIVADSTDGAVAIPKSIVLEMHGLDSRRVRRDSFGVYYYDHRGETLPMVSPFGSIPAEESVSGDATTHAILVQIGRYRSVVLVDEVTAEESVVRSQSNRRRVFSRSLGRELPFVFPLYGGSYDR